MVNKNLFQTFIGKLLPSADIKNEAGGEAYAFSPKQGLAQYAATGCLTATFYADAKEQLAKILEFCSKVDSEFIAKTAVYCREEGSMKDTPALLCAGLGTRDVGLLKKVFKRVIDNGKMLRNFVQITRSGAVGRKSLGSAPKKLIQDWFAERTEENLFTASVGNQPSLGDIIKMVHPKPGTAVREALYRYLIGKEVEIEKLPESVARYERFKSGESSVVPNLPFQFLTSLDIGNEGWKEIARNASWQMTRMNLNTFLRHGVFEDKEITTRIVNRLKNALEVQKAKVFPYQLMVAYQMCSAEVPGSVREALQDAMEVAIQNVPVISGKVVVCPDVSGSMKSAVTGVRKGATTSVRCIDVAALVAAAVLRKNQDASILPFENKVVELKLNPRDSVMTNADKLARIGGGGTNCSAPLAQLNKNGEKADLVIFVSDNESWMDTGAGRGTATMKEWGIFKKKNPKAKLVCIDLQPYGSTQAKEETDILNIGGFSDSVFPVISRFVKGELTPDHWVGEIEKVNL